LILQFLDLFSNGDQSSLVLAAGEGNLEEVQRRLSETNVNINSFHCGATSLMMAAATGHLHVIAFLVDAGADLNIRSHMSKTALIYAAEHNQLAAAHYLTVRGTVLEKEDYFFLGNCSPKIREMVTAGRQMADAIRTARAEGGHSPTAAETRKQISLFRKLSGKQPYPPTISLDAPQVVSPANSNETDTDGEDEGSLPYRLGSLMGRHIGRLLGTSEISPAEVATSSQSPSFSSSSSANGTNSFEFTLQALNTLPQSALALPLCAKRMDVLRALCDQTTFFCSDHFVAMGKAVLFSHEEAFAAMSKLSHLSKVPMKDVRAWSQQIENSSQFNIEEWNQYSQDLVAVSNYLLFLTHEPDQALGSKTEESCQLAEQLNVAQGCERDGILSPESLSRLASNKSNTSTTSNESVNPLIEIIPRFLHPDFSSAETTKVGEESKQESYDREIADDSEVVSVTISEFLGRSPEIREQYYTDQAETADFTNCHNVNFTANTTTASSTSTMPVAGNTLTLSTEITATTTTATITTTATSNSHPSESILCCNPASSTSSATTSSSLTPAKTNLVTDVSTDFETGRSSNSATIGHRTQNVAVEILLDEGDSSTGKISSDVTRKTARESRARQSAKRAARARSGGSSISDLMSVSLAALERTTITTSNSDDDDLHDGISQPSSINSNLETHSSKLSKAYALHTVVRMPLEAANASVAHYPEIFHSNSTSTASTSLGTSSFPPVYSNIETLDITAQVPSTSDSEYHSILSPLNTNQSKVPSSIGPQPASVSSAFTPFHKSSSSSSPPPPASIQRPMSAEPSSTPSKVLAPAMFSFSKSPHLAVFPASMSSLSSTSSSPSPTPAFATWTEEDVAIWLGQISPALMCYVTMFRENAVDGQLLIGLTDEDLEKELGITKKLHRKRILSEIALLKSSPEAILSSSRASLSDKAVASPSFSSSPACAEQFEESVGMMMLTTPAHRAVPCQEFFRLITFSEFFNIECLSGGSSGVTFSAVWKTNNEEKDIVIKRPKGQATVLEWKELQAFLSIPPHPYVLPLLGLSVDPATNQMYFVTERMPFGAVEDYLSLDSPDLPEEKKSQDLCPVDLSNFECIRRIGLQAASALSHLHHHGIVHRDVACRNLLLDKVSNVRLCDFGLARFLHTDTATAQPKYEMKNEGELPVRWMPPESLSKGLFSAKSDVWMLGVTLWEVLTRSMPYTGLPNSVAVARIASGVQLPIPDDTPDWLQQTMRACWAFEADLRPTMNDVVKMLTP